MCGAHALYNILCSQVRTDMKAAVELGNTCRVWFGESLPPEKKEKAEEGKDELLSSDELTEVKEWLLDAHSIIESFQNVIYVIYMCKLSIILFMCE